MTETELLPPEQPKLYAYTFTLYSQDSNPRLVTALGYIAKENLKEHFKGSDLVYENKSEVVLSNQQVVIVDVETKDVIEEVPEDQLKDETCVILKSDLNGTKGNTNEKDLSSCICMCGPFCLR